MLKRKIIFRADGGPTIGMGHFIRTLALAEMLKDYFYCIYATQSPTTYQINEIETVCHERIDLPADESHFNVFLSLLTGDEIVVLDNYYFTTEYQRAIKSKSCKLVCIDDNHDKHFVADVVINHAPISWSNYSVKAYTKLLLGFNYALLRTAFLKSETKKEKLNFKHVLVCFGGADFNNLTNQTLKSIKKIQSIEIITVIIGNAFNNNLELEKVKNQIATKRQIRIFRSVNASQLVEIINEVDFAIVPCSTILYEVLSQQVPVITGFYVVNQTEISSNIKDKYAHIMVIGDLNKIQIKSRHIEQLKNKVLHSGITALIGKRISSLLLNEFNFLNEEFSIKVRKAKYEDVEIYFDWVNDPFVRSNAINVSPINHEDHMNWFQNKINQPNSVLYIFEENQSPIGQVRFDKENDTLIIDYSINKAYRGKNLGKVIMRMAIEKIYTEKLINKIEFLIARVKESNIASIRVFESLNFELESSELVFNNNYLVYIKTIK